MRGTVSGSTFSRSNEAENFAFAKSGDESLAFSRAIDAISEVSLSIIGRGFSVAISALAFLSGLSGSLGGSTEVGFG